MSIRQYRRPIPNSPYKFGFSGWRTPNELPPQLECEEIFVILENPLLELTQKDLAFMKNVGVNPLADVG